MVAVAARSTSSTRNSGNVVLNSNQSFSIGGNGSYDLYTILLHEAGHTFGIGDSTDVSSVMYEDYQGVRTGLAAGDIAALQALYGRASLTSTKGPTATTRWRPPTTTPSRSKPTLRPTAMWTFIGSKCRSWPWARPFTCKPPG